MNMPRVQMTKTVKFALYFLRFYLLFLVVLLAVRFIEPYTSFRPKKEPAFGPPDVRARPGGSVRVKLHARRGCTHMRAKNVYLTAGRLPIL